MAYNIWAEGYSWMGIWGIAIYALLIPLSLRWLWYTYKVNNDVIWGKVVLLLGVLIAFWIHRNSLATTLGFIRNLIYPSFALIVMLRVLKLFKKK